MSTIQVHQATIKNLDTVANLFDAYRQFYGKSSDLEAARKFLLERFNHGESVIFIAYEGNESVGFTQLYPSFSSVSMARIFVLNDLFVTPHGRQKGVAAHLLQAATEYAKATGAVRLLLSTATTNLIAQATYEATGWLRDKQFVHYNFELSNLT